MLSLVLLDEVIGGVVRSGVMSILCRFKDGLRSSSLRSATGGEKGLSIADFGTRVVESPDIGAFILSAGRCILYGFTRFLLGLVDDAASLLVDCNCEFEVGEASCATLDGGGGNGMGRGRRAW